MGEHKFKKSNSSSSSGKGSRTFATTVIIIGVIAVIVGMDVMQNKSKSPLDNFVESRSKGSVEAPIKVVEFLDFQCSHCKTGSEVLKDLIHLNPGMIQLTLKYYPLGQLNSAMSAYYAECAAKQGKFWDMHDKLFETQDEWRTLLKVKPFLNRLASEADIDIGKLGVCASSNKTKKTVDADRAVGDSYSVRSTPTYFINGNMTVGVHSMSKTLKELLAEQMPEEI